MKTLFLALTVIFIGLANASCSYAGSKKGTMKSFSELETWVEKSGIPTDTLIVMDNDDTLSAMPCPIDKSPLDDDCQYLGGAAWFSWQEYLLKHDSSSPYLVATSFDELLDIATLLFSLNYMDYTETVVPKVLQGLSKKGTRLMVETARGISNISATQQQFEYLAVSDHNSTISFAEFINNNALILPNDNLASKASPYIPCNIPGYSEISYQQGVMYVVGQNKGVLLDCFLQEYTRSAVANGNGMSIKNIIFVDDTYKNVVDVYQAFKHSKHYNVTALHYTALSKHKDALTKGKDAKQLQQRAHERWQALKTVIKQNIQKPAI